MIVEGMAITEIVKRTRIRKPTQEKDLLDEMEEEELTPEQKLFYAIVQNHITDAFGCGIALTKKTRILEQQRSTTWILHSREFIEYCDLVGMDGIRIREKMQMRIKTTMQ